VRRVIDALAALEQVAGKRVTALVAAQFAVGHHPPQAGAGRSGTDTEQ
jgi:hypothetical protein